MHHIVVDRWEDGVDADQNVVSIQTPAHCVFSGPCYPEPRLTKLKCCCEIVQVLISIPSLTDPALAPAGKHTLHAYLPATESFAPWSGVQRGTPAYEQLKEERSQILFRAVEKIIPDIRQRAEITMVSVDCTMVCCLPLWT
jgi:hypothetical protein